MIMTNVFLKSTQILELKLKMRHIFILSIYFYNFQIIKKKASKDHFIQWDLGYLILKASYKNIFCHTHRSLDSFVSIKKRVNNNCYDFFTYSQYIG